MENDQNGFRKMSETADLRQGSADAKSGGVSAESAVQLSKGSVSDLQEMLINQIRSRPLRTLGWAAAVGVIVGVISAR